MSSSRTEHVTEDVVEVLMPQMGVSVAEGTVVEWRVAPGDPIEADETVCEISTDKIDIEIPAPAAGTIKRLLAEPGDTVAIGEPIAEIQTGEGEAPAGNGETPGNGHEADRSGIYSPVVRRMASEHGIDLSAVAGHGVGGRVRKKDLVDHIAAASKSSARALHTESPYRPDSEEHGPEELRGPARREPMSAARAKTAEHMLASRRTSAHVTSVIEVDFGRVGEIKAALGPKMADRGVRLTYLAFVAQATVEALTDHPALNAAIEGDELVYFAGVNLGVAVATDRGLIVPVIRDAQRLSLEGMAASISEIAERARIGTLAPDDVHGGTFTITNPGRFGTVLGTPIINQPQVAILDLEAVVPRPVAIDEAIAVRPVGNLCLSFDHRALDGADAARFLADLKSRLETGEAWS